MAKFKITRFFKDSSRRETIHKCLTLSEAQAHCQDPETDSTTCTSEEGKTLTKKHGPWFDGFVEEKPPT